MNKVIRGDCALVMKSLDTPIDLMLWDPPYNTGNKQFLYDDKFASHTSWLSFMSDRFHVAKKLMLDTGAIAVHISYHELFRLGLLMDNIFGEENRLGIINWECSYSPKNNSKGIPSTTDYVLIYAKNKKTFKRGTVPRTDKMNAAYKDRDGGGTPFKVGNICGSWKANDPSVPGSKNNMGKWCPDNITVPGSKNSNYRYGIQNPFTNKIYYAPTGRTYSTPRNSIHKMLHDWGIEYVVDNQGNLVVKEGQDLSKAIEIQKNGPWPKIYFGKSGTSGPVGKRYFNDLKNEGRVLGTYWDSEELGCISLPYYVAGHNGEAKKLIKNILGDDTVFDTPKPLRLTELLIQLLCPDDGIVLDAFAGSGTTAHGVLSLNAQDSNVNRTFILIESEEYAQSITCERIQRVIDGNWAIETKDTVPLGGSFEFFEHKEI